MAHLISSTALGNFKTKIQHIQHASPNSQLPTPNNNTHPPTSKMMMRPFDDDDDEEEEDEDDLIVFKEKQAPDFSLSQLTQKKSQHSQSQESLSPPPRRIIPRHERRKRRNHWKEQQRLDQEAFFNSPELTAPESEDAFESLKSLLQDSQNISPTPKPVPTQQAEHEKENAILKENPRNMKSNYSKRVARAILDDDDESTESLTYNASMTNDDHETNARQSIDDSMPKEVNDTRKNSPIQDDRDEPIIYDDRRPEKSNSRSKEQRSRSRPERSGFESDVEPFSPVRPRKKRRKSRDKTHNNKHRDRSPGKTTRSPRSGSQLGQSSKSKRKSLRQLTPWGTSTNQSQSVTQTQRVTSIVGSRPSSWKKEPEKPLEWKQPRASQKRSTSKSRQQLSTPKAPSMSQIRAKYMPQPQRTKTASSSSTSSSSTATTKRNTSVTRDTDTSQPMASSSGGSRSKPPVSFTPSFLPTSKRRPEDDDVEEVPERDLQRRIAHATSPVQPAATSPLLRHAADLSSPIPTPRTNRRTKKKTIGPWQRRLEALQSARSNDAIRLQNEAFRRHTSSFLDSRNDYRKKSRSHTDITILGDCPTSSLKQQTKNGTQDPAATKLAVLVYIHSHTEHFSDRQRQQPNTSISQQQQQQPSLQDQLAWATFTFLTARSINLQKGKQLRLYNSIILPCPQPITVEGFTNNVDSTRPNHVCERMIVSTWLCENHPGGLPKLSLGACREPAPPTAAAQVPLP